MAKWTKCTKETFLKTFKNNGENVSNACEVVKIGRTAYYKCLEKYPKFKQAIEDIKEESNEKLVILAKEGLEVNLRKSKQSAIEYVLNNKTNGEYSNTRRNEISGLGGRPVEYKFILEFPKDDYEPRRDKSEINQETI